MNDFNYWNATDVIMQKHGGEGPPCEECGKPMYPLDDYGSFACVCGYKADAFSRLHFDAGGNPTARKRGPEGHESRRITPTPFVGADGVPDASYGWVIPPARLENSCPLTARGGRNENIK